MSSPAVAAMVDHRASHREALFLSDKGAAINPLNDPEVRLTKKERQLLAILMQNPGKCISREILLRTVWNYSEDAKTRTVDVHVQRLRRKLGEEGASCIKTIVRAGYCWFPDFRRV